jgi:hypothetical protein
VTGVLRWSSKLEFEDDHANIFFSFCFFSITYRFSDLLEEDVWEYRGIRRAAAVRAILTAKCQLNLLLSSSVAG